MLRSADLVVACSEGLREEALMLEPGARVVTVHNGIDVNRFLAESTRSFEWPPALKGRKVIIQVGSFQHRKGHDLLVEAFQSVRQRHPETALLLVGSTGAEGDAVRRLVCQLGLQNSVWLFENVPHEQILGILARCDLFVLCSRWEKGVVGEGFAIALLEAAVAGLPVVATASCGVPEIIKDRVTGLLVPLEDTDAIGRAICEMIENTDLAYRTAANLSRLVAEEFTWSRAVKAYLSLAG
jgi:glycosyltransferase involved in cell wall biosynthesis